MTIDLDRLEAVAKKQAAAYAQMLEYGEGVGGLGVRHPEMFNDMLIWDGLSENEHADNVLALIALARRAEEAEANRDEFRAAWNVLGFRVDRLEAAIREALAWEDPAFEGEFAKGEPYAQGYLMAKRNIRRILTDALNGGES